MSSENTFANAQPVGGQRRVVEAEIRMPRLEDLPVPKVNLEPARAVLEDVLLTGLGAGVLLARGLADAARAAHRAGSEAAEKPDSFTRTLVDLVRPGGGGRAEADSAIKIRVPVLPIDGYDDLAASEIIARLEGLGEDELEVLHEYESRHQARPEVLAALEERRTSD